MNPVSYYADKHPEEISRLSDDVLRKLSFQERKLDDVQENLLDTAPTSTEIFAAEIYTTVAAISLSCNFLLLFLISRKKYPDEESKQPTYHRIMCALAITSSFSAGNYFVAGISGSLAKNMNFDIYDSSKSIAEFTEIVQELSEPSLGCYIQSIIDYFFYMAFILCCCWLCLYFLLRLNYGVARISPFVEAALYFIIFLFAFGYTAFSFVNGTEVPVNGICVIFPSGNLDNIFFGVFLNTALLLGILTMLLIIYKTFRDEQQINDRSLSTFRQLSNQQQEHLHPAISLTSFEATKDIAMQALALVVFLIFAFYIQVFFASLSLTRWYIIDGILWISQGINSLGLYLWFEIRNVKKEYPNKSTKDILKAVFNQGGNMERVKDNEAREQTPLLVEKQRCLIDITLVEDDLCADVMNTFREVDAHDDDEEEALRQAKRKEEEKRLKLQEENMRMFSVGEYDSDNIRSLHQALEVSFGNLDLEIANRKLNHYNASKDASKPVIHRYGSIDPTTFRTETTEEEIDNLSAEGTQDQSMLKIEGEGIFLEEIQEGDEEEETESSKDDSKNQEQDSSTNAPSTQQPQQGGRSAVSDLTMISTLRF